MDLLCAMQTHPGGRRVRLLRDTGRDETARENGRRPRSLARPTRSHGGMGGGEVMAYALIERARGRGERSRRGQEELERIDQLQQISVRCLRGANPRNPQRLALCRRRARIRCRRGAW